MRHDVLSQQNAHPYAFRARQTNQQHQGGRIAAAAVDAKISLQNPFVVAEKEERKKERKKARAKIYRRGRQEATAGQKMQTYRDFLRLNLCDRLWNRRDEIRWRFDRALSPSFGG